MLLWVKDDLDADFDIQDSGSNGMTIEQILRAAILKQANGWSYEVLAINCADSEMTRAFVKLNYGEYYGKSCLHANITKIRGETWKNINDLLVRYAKKKALKMLKPFVSMRQQ